jgi:hypothetical protein
METHTLELGQLIKAADRCRDLGAPNANNLRALIGDPDLDLEAALWPDLAEPRGVAVAIVKGADLFVAPSKSRRSRKRAGAFWLRDEAHFNALTDEVAKLVEQATTVRGEFLPIGDDVAFEAVPNTHNAEEFYVTKGGVRIARRGRPGTREAKRWIPLIPSYAVRDIDYGQIESFTALTCSSSQMDPYTNRSGVGRRGRCGQSSYRAGRL